MADRILVNGKVFSVDLDGKVTRGEAVAIKDGKILEIGTDEQIRALADDSTDIIDCGGNTILPGLCDAHCHPSIAATLESGANLFELYVDEEHPAEEVIEALCQRVKEFADANPDKKVVRGTGWVIQGFQAAGRMPTRHDLDKVCPDRPVILESFCQHNLWVNTKAIEIAGVDADTPDTKIGQIFREEDGYPEGVFNDPEAMALIKYGVPGYDLTVEEYKEGLMYYQHECANKYGVTFVQDCMHSNNARDAYKELAEEGKLTIRARCVDHLEPAKYEEQMPVFIEEKGKYNVGNDFRIDTVKMFAEGAFSMLDGYLPEYCQAIGVPEDFNGPLYWPDDIFVEYAAKAMEAGFNVHVHAMGDKSVKQSAECLAKAQQKVGKQPRNIIAHLMITPDETAELMGKEKIIANCQPAWMMLEDDVYGEAMMFGMDKAIQSYPFRKFIDNGVRVAFGTDFPVTPPPDTMQEICVAMTRHVDPHMFSYEKYKNEILGDEKPATLAEAVQALSINGAFQMFGEEYTGSIEKGKSAELVVLDSDIEALDPEDIYAVKIAKTLFKGEVVYEL